MITRISFCKSCNKLLYIRNLCSVCSMNFGNMRKKELDKAVEEMNEKRISGFDFNSKCELCGMDSEMQLKGEESQFCIDCK